PCDDGDVCTLDETCADGVCVEGPPVDCSQWDDGCIEGTCDPATGQCAAKPNSTLCVDDDWCTTESCDDEGVCQSEPIEGCDGPAQCNPPCAEGETCQDGACVCTPITDCGTVTCGALGDGCGGIIECGVCGDGQTCNDGVCQDPVNPPATTYTKDAQPIYGDKCGPCHTFGSSGGHSIGTHYDDGLLDSYHCAGLTKAECTLVRIADGSMPVGQQCGGPVPDDAPNADKCVTQSEYATLEAWIAGGMLE
ncbi:MAG: hypothetical protein QF464_24050, partial [Myxococcota bacterium]|nr:hypothetical protein [Myxococcota bacterium]